jgi:hypothetical protein
MSWKAEPFTETCGKTTPAIGEWPDVPIVTATEAGLAAFACMYPALRPGREIRCDIFLVRAFYGRRCSAGFDFHP